MTTLRRGGQFYSGANTLRRGQCFFHKILISNDIRIFGLARISQCAVQRRHHSVGENPTRQMSFQPVAIGTVVEVTKRLKLPVKRVLKGTWRTGRP